MGKVLRVLLYGLALLIVGLGVAAFWAYRASQQVPVFYQQALRAEPVRQAEAAEELERQMLELHKEVGETGRWEVEFTEQQIDGWLASHLPAKWAATLPAGVKDPRVAIHPGKLLVACKYERPNLSTVISLAVDVQLTDEPNVVAVRIRQAKAGTLPVPLGKFLDRIAAKAAEADIPLRWEHHQAGDIVALVTIPTEHEQYVHRQVFIETIELRSGSLYLAGLTDADEAASRRQRLTQLNRVQSAEHATVQR